MDNKMHQLKQHLVALLLEAGLGLWFGVNHHGLQNCPRRRQLLELSQLRFVPEWFVEKVHCPSPECPNPLVSESRDENDRPAAAK